MPAPSFRTRLFTALALVALIPAALLLFAGTGLLREMVQSAGSAGAWEQVAETGQELVDGIEGLETPPAPLVEAAERHREELAESVRLSRVYEFLADRVFSLLPVVAGALLGLVGIAALLTANRLSRGLSRPVEELVQWTRHLGAGTALPAPGRNDDEEIREFGVLKAAFRDAADRLQEARRREEERIRTQSWSEMAQKVAHELKNPLTPMRIAAERVARASDPGLAEAGKVLQEEIRHLDSLARTFSQFGRPPEGPMSLVDLSEMIASLVRRVATPDVPIETDLPDEPLEVTGHLEALERVLRNLLANAHDATMARPGGPLPIRIEARRVANGVEVRVLDRGPGIPEAALPRIWQPDFTSKRRGTGLGLPLVRQAVRAHGGEVWAGNRDGGGAEFVVRLPFGSAA